MDAAAPHTGVRHGVRAPLDPQELKLGEGRRGTRRLGTAADDGAKDLTGYDDGDRIGDGPRQLRRPAHLGRGTRRIGVPGMATTVPVLGTPTGAHIDVHPGPGHHRSGNRSRHPSRTVVPDRMQPTRREPMHSKQPHQHPEHAHQRRPPPQGRPHGTRLGSGHVGHPRGLLCIPRGGTRYLIPDWLGVPRHTFHAVFGAAIAQGRDYRETFHEFRPGFDLHARITRVETRIPDGT